MLNVLEHKSMHGYVEGQVLGGVSIEDIDTVYIPDSPDNPRDIMQQTEQLKARFPGVKFELARRAENV